MAFNEYLVGVAIISLISLATSAVVLAAIYFFIKKAEIGRLEHRDLATQVEKPGPISFGSGSMTLASAVHGNVQFAGSNNKYQSDATIASTSRVAAAA